MSLSFRRFASLLIALLLFLLSGCSLFSLSQEKAIQEMTKMFPGCTVTDSGKWEGTLYVTMKTAHDVVFMTEYRGWDDFVSYYTTDVLRANMDTIIENAPEGVSVEKEEHSAIVEIYIEGQEYIDAAASYCAYIEQLLDYNVGREYIYKTSYYSLAISDIALSAYVYDAQSCKYLHIKYSKNIPVVKSKRLGYEGMYEWLMDGYEALEI